MPPCSHSLRMAEVPATLLLAAALLAGTHAANCDMNEEYAVRLCTAPRAPRTCAAVKLAGTGDLCAWQERCMRCVPKPDFLSATCEVDGMFFYPDGRCPTARDTSLCEDCESLLRQEICLGICSHTCRWHNISRFNGELCGPLVVLEIRESYIAVIILGVVAVISCFVGLGLVARWIGKIRREALEEFEAKIRAKHLKRLHLGGRRLAITGHSGSAFSAKSSKNSAGSELPAGAASSWRQKLSVSLHPRHLDPQASAASVTNSSVASGTPSGGNASASAATPS